MPQLDPFGAFSRGLDTGHGIGDGIRNANAYRDGGLDAVAEQSGRAGDMEGMEYARGMQRRQRQFQSEEQRAAYQRMEQIAPWARNVVRATRSMDPQRAGAFLSRPDIRQRFMDWGFDENQINAGIAGLASEDPAVRQQWQQELEAAFTQHQNPEWNLVGRQAVAIEPESGSLQLGGTLPEGMGTEWRPVTPQEAQQWGLPSGSIWDVNTQTGERKERHRPNAPRNNGYGGSYPDDGYDYEE